MDPVITVFAMLNILFSISSTVGILIFYGWDLNIIQSIAIILTVGLCIDFSIHYGVAFQLAEVTPIVNSVAKKLRYQEAVDRLKHTLYSVGSAVFVASLTTFMAGTIMTPSQLLTYFEFGRFLMVVMGISWAFSTFFFLSLCLQFYPIGYLERFFSFRKKHSYTVTDEKRKTSISQPSFMDTDASFKTAPTESSPSRDSLCDSDSLKLNPVLRESSDQFEEVNLDNDEEQAMKQVIDRIKVNIVCPNSPVPQYAGIANPSPKPAEKIRHRKPSGVPSPP